MRVLLLNSVCGYGSTGRIVLDIAKEYEAQGAMVKIAYGRKEATEDSSNYAIRIGKNIDIFLHGVISMLFDKHGLGSKHATKQFLLWAEKFNPNILWIHNIHGYYINYDELFRWIKSRPNMQVRWTLHDCWAITGHCSHFIAAGCDKWKKECHHCKEYGRYPRSIFSERAKKNYYRKKECFTGVKNLQIITPSNWMKECIQDSFLKEYKVIVKKNKIDTKYFCNISNLQKVKEVYRKYIDTNVYEEKKIVLGVASIWSEGKGLFDFVKLSELLPSNEYLIILVGVTKKQMKKLPNTIIGVMRTSSKEELAAFYNGAFMYVNFSYEETFPTTNLEAVACGTRVISYDTGGSKETLSEEDFLISRGNVEEASKIIINYGKNKKKRQYC